MEYLTQIQTYKNTNVPIDTYIFHYGMTEWFQCLILRALRRVLKKDINKTKVVHENSKCSKCGQSPIEGIRYYCLKCETFELCSACEKNYGEKHGHELLKIRRPEDFNIFKNEIIKQKELQNLNKIEENEEKKIDLTKCHSKCMNLKKMYTTLNNNNFLPIEIIIKNTGDEQWPTPCFFTCDESSEVKGDRVKLVKCTGKPEEEYKLKFKIILKDINKTGIYKSIWQLKNENDEVFGEKIEIVIKDIFEKDKKLRGGKKDKKGNIACELKNGNGMIKSAQFEGEYLMENM